jgi:hypothetical protein
MDASTKQRLLRQEFEALRPCTGGVPWAPPELLIPASQAPKFLRRLAELDIALLYGVDLLELQPDHSVLVKDTRQFGKDRTLGLTEAARFVQSHLATSGAMLFSYDVSDDIPWSERASILRAKPSLRAQLRSGNQVHVTVTGAAALQAAVDLVWHHVRLVQVRVVRGETLELIRTPIEWLAKPFNPSRASRRETGSGRGVDNPVPCRVVNETDGIRITGDSGRYEQLEQTTAWIRDVLTGMPDGQFYLMGTMLSYTSPLPEDQWLLPSDLSRT